MDVPLHEDFLEGPPPPPHHSNFSYLQVKGVDMRIVMPKRSDTEEALVIFVLVFLGRVKNECIVNFHCFFHKINRLAGCL